jgi:hypothetical protein
MPDYVAFFLDASPEVYRIETLEIAHPSFSQSYWVQSQVPAGVELGLEGGGSQFFQYVPTEITPRSEENDLEAGYRIALGDLGLILQGELDRIAADGAWNIRPTITYRQYRSDELDAPMTGPEVFEMQGVNFNAEGATFDASARTLNLNRTGERYTVTRFPMLAGFIT